MSGYKIVGENLPALIIESRWEYVADARARCLELPTPARVVTAYGKIVGRNAAAKLQDDLAVRESRRSKTKDPLKYRPYAN